MVGTAPLLLQIIMHHLQPPWSSHSLHPPGGSCTCMHPSVEACHPPGVLADVLHGGAPDLPPPLLTLNAPSLQAGPAPASTPRRSPSTPQRWMQPPAAQPWTAPAWSTLTVA